MISCCLENFTDTRRRPDEIWIYSAPLEHTSWVQKARSIIGALISICIQLVVNHFANAYQELFEVSVVTFHTAEKSWGNAIQKIILYTCSANPKLHNCFEWLK